MENSQGLHAEETALVKTPHLSSGPPGAASSCGRCVLVAPQHAMLTQLGRCVWHPLHAKLCATLSSGSGDRVKNQEMGPDTWCCGHKQGARSSFPTHCKGREQCSRAVILPLIHTHTHSEHRDTRNTYRHTHTDRHTRAIFFVFSVNILFNCFRFGFFFQHYLRL